MEQDDLERRPPAERSQENESELDSRPARPAERPVPGVKHVPEPDAENIMPAEDEPGTL
jgi:hypothetical protein